MTKEQAVFMQTAFRELIGERPCVEVSWYEYKSWSHPLEIEPRRLTRGWKDTNEFVIVHGHDNGDCSFAISTDYGMTGSPEFWENISIDADDWTIHFKYMEGDKVKVYRAFKLLPDEGTGYSQDIYRKWQDMMKESWKLRTPKASEPAIPAEPEELVEKRILP